MDNLKDVRERLDNIMDEILDIDSKNEFKDVKISEENNK